MNDSERELMRVALEIQHLADHLEDLFGGGPGCAELVADMRRVAYESTEYVLGAVDEGQ